MSVPFPTPEGPVMTKTFATWSRPRVTRVAGRRAARLTSRVVRRRAGGPLRTDAWRQAGWRGVRKPCDSRARPLPPEHRDQLVALALGEAADGLARRDLARTQDL